MISGLQTLKAAEIELGKLFSDDYDFVIPDYQRPYAWGSEESLQLLADLRNALDSDTDEPYFLGSIVLVKNPQESRSEVIDGQQRLTTLTLLLAVMRDMVDDEDLSRHIHKFIEAEEIKWAEVPAKPRLTLRRRDNQFFRDYVQTEHGTVDLMSVSDNVSKTESQSALRDNASALYEELQRWNPHDLPRLFKMLGQKTFMVVVSTPDLNSAYRIFSVMNSRGMPLSPPDVFKSQVIGAIPESDRAHYSDLWEELEQDLGREEFGNLFLYLLYINSPAQRLRGVLQEFPRQILHEYVDANNGVGFMKEILEPYAEAAKRIANQDFEGQGAWQSVNIWLTRLAQVSNDDWRPTALWALRHHGEDPEFLSVFLERLERLVASMLIRRIHADIRRQRYGRVLRELAAGEGIGASAFELSEDEKRETVEALDSEIYLLRNVPKYVLLRLDSILANDPSVSYEHPVISVEHVLPQTPRPDSQWVIDFSEDERAYWTHRLANLVLLNRRRNSSARNYDFERKKNSYFQSAKGATGFILTSLVRSCEDWTPVVLESRQRQLLGHLIEAWSLD